MIRAAILLTALARLASAQALEGKIIEDHTGNPLASVEVQVFRDGARGLAADLETDTTGSFSAPGLPAAEYRLEISKPNFLHATLRVHGPGAPLRIRMVRCGVITGQVVDAQGQPVLGAHVFALPKATDGLPMRPFESYLQGSSATVNDRGQYRLYNLPAGEYAVAVTYGASTMTVGGTGSAAVKGGVGSGVQFYPTNAKPQFFAVAGGEDYRNIDFSVLPVALFSVSGKIELPTQARGSYWVSLLAVDQPAIATCVTQSEKDGSFKLEGVSPGSYHLLVSGPSTARTGRGGIMGAEAYYARSSVTVGGANIEGLSVTMHKGRSATFTLRSAVSQPSDSACPPSAKVTLTSLEDWAAMLDKSVDIVAGKDLTIDDLAPGRYHVGASELGKSCYQAGRTVLDLTGGSDSRPIAVMVAPAGSIRGRLTSTTAPASYAVALIGSDPDDQQSLHVALVDAQGRFSFTGLRPGKYRISAQPAAAAKARWVAPGRSTEIQVPGGAPTDVELPAPPAQNQ